MDHVVVDPATDSERRQRPEVSKNLEPLSAFGVSGWVDDDVVHGLLKVTTD